MTQARHREDRRGTISGWVRDRCRCPECGNAWRLYCGTRYANRDPKNFGPARQVELLNIVADGVTIADAAKRLGVSKSTVVLLARARTEFRVLLDQALDSKTRHQRARPSTRCHRGSPHGTLTTYDQGCRCERCEYARADVDARNTSQRKSRKARRAERVLEGNRWVHPGAKHGTISGYNNYTCRCVLCTEAWAEYARSLYRRKKSGG